MKKKSIILGGVIIIGVLAAAYLALSNQSVTVVTETVNPEQLTLYVEEVAEAKLKQHHIVYGMSGGVIDAVLKTVGQKVESGEVLLELDDASLLLQTEEMRQQLLALKAEYESVRSSSTSADIRYLEAAYRSSKQSYDVAQTAATAGEILLSSGAISEEDYQQTIGQLQVKEAEMLKTRASLSQANNGMSSSEEKQYAARIAATEAKLEALLLQLEQLTYKAPMDGIVLSRSAEIGGYVSPGVALYEIGNPQSLYFTSDLLVEDLPGIEIGTPVRMIHDTLGGTVLNGVVKDIAPIAVNVLSDLGISQKRVRVSIDLVDQNQTVKMGYTVTARFILSEKEDAFTIDEDALFEMDKQPHVFIVQDGRAALRQVSVGLEMGNRVEILSGLNIDDQVIRSPGETIVEGTRVEVANQD